MSLEQRNRDIVAFYKSGMTILDISHAFVMPVTRVFSLLVHLVDLSVADIRTDREKVKENDKEE